MFQIEHRQPDAAELRSTRTQAVVATAAVAAGAGASLWNRRFTPLGCGHAVVPAGAVATGAGSLLRDRKSCTALLGQYRYTFTEGDVLGCTRSKSLMQTLSKDAIDQLVRKLVGLV